MTLQLLKQYAQSQQSRYIATASRYLSDFASCLSGGACPSKLFDMDSPEAWQKALEEAKERLTFHDPNSAILEKSFSDGTNIKSGAIMEYEAILSASGKDRDGDILHPEGMRLDRKMPDLWQHIQSSPTGTLIEIKEQNENRLVCKFAIADTELGRDTAALMRIGALRKSHGFMPGASDVVEAIGFTKNSKGQDVPTGFRVKGCDVLESSNVSIPAHPGAEVIAVFEKEFDGVCTLFGQKKFNNDAIKRWAKSVYDARPVQTAGVTLEDQESSVDESNVEHMTIRKGGMSVRLTSTGDITMDVDNESVRDVVMGKPSKAQPKQEANSSGGSHSMGGDTVAKSAQGVACGCQTKTIKTKSFDADLLTKSYGMPDHLPGSFEEIRTKATKAARKVLEDNGDFNDDNGWMSVIGTYADRIVVCCHGWSRSGSKEKCYSVPISMGDDGEIEASSEYSKIEVQATVVEKSRDESLGLIVKSWRSEFAESIPTKQILSDVNATCLAKALLAKSIAGDEQATDEIVRAAETAKSLNEASQRLEAFSV
jgi:hypothetical protein